MCICILFVIEEESQLVFAFLKFPAISFCSSGVVCSACLLGVNGEAVTHVLARESVWLVIGVLRGLAWLPLVNNLTIAAIMVDRRHLANLMYT